MNKTFHSPPLHHARSMDVYISRLRKYLAADAAIGIINIRGQGYKLVDQVSGISYLSAIVNI